jgi:hypothetical protein
MTASGIEHEKPSPAQADVGVRTSDDDGFDATAFDASSRFWS